ncbi:MAG: MOSC domain-containing protein [Acidobacteria bacterium]|nr:MOSC domain-containing protein [Acidobacteriota bacterium]
MTPRLARIRIFPVKALDPVETEEARVLGGAGLEHDREFRLADAEGRAVNGKLLGEKILRLRSRFDFAFSELSVQNGRSSLEARLPGQARQAERWFSEQFGAPVHLEHRRAGFPDDTDASGPTLVSRATLETVAEWFALELEETRRRFRSNLEIEGVPAFWEDRLFGPAGRTVPFTVGDVCLEGVNPCARCTVPTRNSRTGAPEPPGFAKLFAEKRRATLPDWAEPSRFDHFFRLTLNTRIPDSENGKVLQIGDEIRL